MQRCFRSGQNWGDGVRVFSVCAEMFLVRWLRFPQRGCFLCACRDVSEGCPLMVLQLLFSLHIQRCFLERQSQHLGQYVLSALVEMFLRFRSRCAAWWDAQRDGIFFAFAEMLSSYSKPLHIRQSSFYACIESFEGFGVWDVIASFTIYFMGLSLYTTKPVETCLRNLNK